MSYYENSATTKQARRMADRREKVNELLHAWAAYRSGHMACGHLSGSRGGSAGLSRPEAAANRLSQIEAVDRIIRSMLSRRQMRLVVARYVCQLPSDRQIAERLRLNRKYVGPAYDDLRIQIDKMLRLGMGSGWPVHNILTAGPHSHNLSLRLEKCL
jgi:hypothetical protein